MAVTRILACWAPVNFSKASYRLKTNSCRNLAPNSRLSVQFYYDYKSLLAKIEHWSKAGKHPATKQTIKSYLNFPAMKLAAQKHGTLAFRSLNIKLKAIGRMSGD
jgi:hypothetical protein